MFDQPPPPATSLQVSASRLLTICRQLAPAYLARHTIPVLGTALVKASPDGASFTVTDLDIQVTVTADDLISAEPWQACVPFVLLRRLAATLDGLVTIAFSEGGTYPAGKMDQLTLSTEDGFSATINLICREIDFPILPDRLEAAPWHEMTMAPADLCRYLNLTSPCISTEETRYYLNGVHLCRKPGGSTLRAVATDGHRLAVIDGATEVPEAISAIIPTVAVRAMLSLVSHKSNDAVVFRLNTAINPSGGASRMRLDHGQVRIDCKLIDGTYPDYTRVMPQNATRGTITLTAATLRRLSAIMTERGQAVAFRNGRATIKSPDIQGEISVPAPMEMANPGDQLEIGFNLRLILAQARMTATFRMELLGPSDPARVRAEDPDALWVIMPMRV